MAELIGDFSTVSQTCMRLNGHHRSLHPRLLMTTIIMSYSYITWLPSSHTRMWRDYHHVTPLTAIIIPPMTITMTVIVIIDIIMIVIRTNNGFSLFARWKRVARESLIHRFAFHVCECVCRCTWIDAHNVCVLSNVPMCTYKASVNECIRTHVWETHVRASNALSFLPFLTLKVTWCVRQKHK